MNSPQDRARSRKQVLLPGQRPPRRSAVVSADEIKDDLKTSGIPDDTDKTGVKGMRNKPVLEGEKDPKVKKLYGK